MFNLLKIRINHGFQTIKNIKKAEIDKMFRGMPELSDSKCKKDCKKCVQVCPTKAVSIHPLTIDLGKCIFCGECQRECIDNHIKFTNFHKLSVTKREDLIIDETTNQKNFLKKAIKSRKEIKKVFGKSLKLRQVSAGGCNGCEMELNACLNVNFDMGRFGIDIVASPRHADGIIVTGPITENMEKPLLDTYLCIPDPKIIILAGSCAISGGIFFNSKAINRDFLKKYNPDLYIPGCPIHPLTFINGILRFLGL